MVAPEIITASSGTGAIEGAIQYAWVIALLPFEAISFLLLAALIGAIVLARKDEGN